MRPVIGITSKWDEEEGRYLLPRGYADAVYRAGGMPLILPFLQADTEIQELLSHVDGLLLAGGGDVDPSWFGEEPHPNLGRVDPQRDAFEILLTHLALAREVPILAICRGIQVLAVAGGGALYQDIPSQIKGALQHYQKAPEWYPAHAIHVKPGSKLARVLQASSARVNSYHHQSVKVLPRGFQVAAEAGDGVVEAIEGLHHRFALGVQWHPETMWEKDPLALRLFAGLVDAAAGKPGEMAARAEPV